STIRFAWDSPSRASPAFRPPSASTTRRCCASSATATPRSRPSRRRARWVSRHPSPEDGGGLARGDLLDQLLGESPAERLVSLGHDGERPGAADHVVLEVFFKAARRIGV